MKRNPALHPLSHDHHQGLILAQQLKKGAPQYRGMPATIQGKKNYMVTFYNTDLKKHFNKEEEILFPFVKNKEKKVDDLIIEIVNEHRKMEKLISEVENTNELAEKLDELGWLLEKHIRKEERILFVEIEKILNEDELEKLKNQLAE